MVLQAGRLSETSFHFPDFVIRHSSAPTAWFLGASDADDFDLLERMQESLDNDFFRWSVDQALKWPGERAGYKTTRIHGSADRLLLCRNASPDITIDGGSHLMIYSRADEINRLLDQLISQYPN